jgi:hypothetical protein
MPSPYGDGRQEGIGFELRNIIKKKWNGSDGMSFFPVNPGVEVCKSSQRKLRTRGKHK